MTQKHSFKMQQKASAEQHQSEDWKSCYEKAEKLYAQRDYQGAFAWYEKASAFPDCNPIVFFELGYLFQHGEGVDSDEIEALKWYEKAASLDVPQAMYNLAYFYLNGIVVDKDIERAARLLRNATLLMDRLQLERDLYNTWKAELEARLSDFKKKAEEEKARAEDLQLRNRELDLSLSAENRECQRLKQELAKDQRALQEAEERSRNLAAQMETTEAALHTEQMKRKEVETMAAVRQEQMEKRLQDSSALITNLVREHNESFERVQSSYASQFERLERAYKTDLTKLQKEKELLAKEKMDLYKMVNGKITELSAQKESFQKIETAYEREQTKKKVILVIAGILALLNVIFILVLTLI